MPFWYISFCDINKPEGQKFLGATIVEARDEKRAIQEARRRGCNPGGEAAILQIEHPSEKDQAAFDFYFNKFVPRDEVLTKHGGGVPLHDVTDDAAQVCQSHNPRPN